ncbi:MAG: hypothetical protein KGD58_06605 [Candidatus Lokiarchaeota archaeon]|nr:hypothetical protein [Candidatus Lokiarchaeota archaeon]
MISDSSIQDDIAICEESITKILDRAVKLFKRTDLPELAEKWDIILKTYRSKKRR